MPLITPKNFKVDQVAFISHADDHTETIKRTLGLEDGNWTEDFVWADGNVHGVPGSNYARLLFNYDLGIELEILQYISGPNYAENIPSGQLCHIGMHWDGTGDAPTFGDQVIQEVVTSSHTNPFLVREQRHYRYTIFDTKATAGVYLKVIERLSLEAWAQTQEQKA